MSDKLGESQWPLDFVALNKKYHRLQRRVERKIKYFTGKRHELINQLPFSDSVIKKHPETASRIHTELKEVKRILTTLENKLRMNTDRQSLLHSLLHPDNPDFYDAWSDFYFSSSMLYAKIETLETNNKIFSAKLIEFERENKDKTKHKRAVLRELTEEIKIKIPLFRSKYDALMNATKLEMHVTKPKLIISDAFFHGKIYSRFIDDFSYNKTQSIYPKNKISHLIDVILIRILKKKDIKIMRKELFSPCFLNIVQDKLYGTDNILIRKTISKNNNTNSFLSHYTLRDFLLGEPHRIHHVDPIHFSAPFWPMPSIRKVIQCGKNSKLNNLLNNEVIQLSIATDVMSELSLRLQNQITSHHAAISFKKNAQAIIWKAIVDNRDKLLSDPNLSYQYIIDTYLSGFINPGLVFYKDKIIPGLVYLGEGHHRIIISIENSALILFSHRKDDNYLFQFIYSHLSEIDRDEFMNEPQVDNIILPLKMKIDAILTELDYRIVFRPYQHKDIFLILFKAHIDKLISNIDGIIYTREEKNTQLSLSRRQEMLDFLSGIIFLETFIVGGPLAITLLAMTSAVLMPFTMYNDLQRIKLSDRHTDIDNARNYLVLNTLLSSISFVSDMLSLTKVMGRGINIIDDTKRRLSEFNKNHVFDEILSIKKDDAIFDMLKNSCHGIVKRGAASSKRPSVCQYAIISSTLEGKLTGQKIISAERAKIMHDALPDVNGFATGIYNEKYIKHGEGYIFVSQGENGFFIIDNRGHRLYLENKKGVLTTTEKDKSYSDNNLLKVNLTPDDFITIKDYGAMGYSNVNDYLRCQRRGWSRMAGELDNYINDIDSVLSKIPSYRGVVYRGSVINSYDLHNIEFFKVFSNKEYWSSSLNINKAYVFSDIEVASSISHRERLTPVLYEINLKTAGKPIWLYTMKRDECEVLIAHDSFFKLKSINKDMTHGEAIHIILDEMDTDEIMKSKDLMTQLREREPYNKGMPSVGNAEKNVLSPVSDTLRKHIADTMLLTKAETGPLKSLGLLGISTDAQLRKYISIDGKYILLQEHGSRSYIMTNDGHHIYVDVKNDQFDVLDVLA